MEIWEENILSFVGYLSGKKIVFFPKRNKLVFRQQSSVNLVEELFLTKTNKERRRRFLSNVASVIS